jgi:hypothetical protein
MTKRNNVGAYDREHCVTLSTVSDRIIDNCMLVCGFVSSSFLHICHSFLRATEVDLSKTLVEKNLGREQSELETQLLIVTVDHFLVVLRANDGTLDSHGLIASKIQQSFLEILQGKIISCQKEIGNTALEIALFSKNR